MEDEIIGFVLFQDGVEQKIVSNQFEKDDLETIIGKDFKEIELNNGRKLFYNNLSQLGSEFNQIASQMVIDYSDNGIPIFGKAILLNKINI